MHQPTYIVTFIALKQKGGTMYDFNDFTDIFVQII